MSLKIDQDHGRFRHIVRGKIRQNLRKYISQGELLGRQGKDVVSIPIPQIDIPRFRFGDKQQGGAGQGDGDPGDPMGGEESEQGDGTGKAGEGEGEHILEVDVTLDELAAILGEELELPDIENKGKSKLVDEKDRYTGIRRVGPESLRHFRRTYREALKRQMGYAQTIVSALAVSFCYQPLNGVSGEIGNAPGARLLTNTGELMKLVLGNSKIYQALPWFQYCHACSPRLVPALPITSCSNLGILPSFLSHVRSYLYGKKTASETNLAYFRSMREPYDKCQWNFLVLEFEEY